MDFHTEGDFSSFGPNPEAVQSAEVHGEAAHSQPGAVLSCLPTPFGAGRVLVTEFIKNACAKRWDNYSKFVWGWGAAVREISKCVSEKISAVLRESSSLQAVQQRVCLLARGWLQDTPLGALLLPTSLGLLPALQCLCVDFPVGFGWDFGWGGCICACWSQEECCLERRCSLFSSFCPRVAWLMQQTINLQSSRISPNATPSIGRR